MSEYTVITSPVLDVTITSSVTSLAQQKRYDKNITVSDLKCKLELLTGATAATMRLEVYDKHGSLVCTLDNDNALLGMYPIDDGCRLHVVDTAGPRFELEDVSKVVKYDMPSEEYEKRTDSVRAFKERMKLGRFQDVDPEVKQKQEAEKLRLEEEEREAASRISVGSRCEVTLLNQPAKRGTVMYVGLTDFKPGYWVGIRYDEPVGKHDGEVSGRRYFQCPMKYGVFAKPKQVAVGDFPELSLDDELMEM